MCHHFGHNMRFSRQEICWTSSKSQYKSILGGRFAYSQAHLPISIETTVFRGFSIHLNRGALIYQSPLHVWVVTGCLSLSLPLSLLSSSKNPTERGSQTGVRSSGSDVGDRRWQNVRRAGRGASLAKGAPGRNKCSNTQATGNNRQEATQTKAKSLLDVKAIKSNEITCIK